MSSEASSSVRRGFTSTMETPGEKVLFIDGNLRAKILYGIIAACAVITLTLEIVQHAIGYHFQIVRYGIGILGSIGPLLFISFCFLRCRKPWKQCDYPVFGLAFVMIIFALLIISCGIRSIVAVWLICTNHGAKATSVGNCSPDPVALETVKVTVQFLNLFCFLFYIVACIKNFCKRYYEEKYKILS